MLELNPGNRVLDVGCGTGDDAREIAALVGPTGTVVGLDASATMVAEARKRALATELSIEFIEGDALNLPFPAESWQRSAGDRDPARNVSGRADGHHCVCAHSMGTSRQ